MPAVRPGAAAAALGALVLVVAAPSVGSRERSDPGPVDDRLFRPVAVGDSPPPPSPDPRLRSAGALEPGEPVLTLDDRRPAVRRPKVDQPEAVARVVVRAPPAARSVRPVSRSDVAGSTGGGWHLDPSASWYGPGFYGRRTACGREYPPSLHGVAHRTLPCGTRVTFRNPRNGRTITVPVVDRGPYVAGRTWDLTGATCSALDHCYTGPLEWRFP